MVATGLIASESGFHAPSVAEFFPPVVFFEDTMFRMTRINLIQLFMVAVVIVFFAVAFRKPQFVPRGIQNAGEVVVSFVRISIAEEALGNKAKAYLPFLTTLFVMLFAFNVTGFIPPFQIAGTSIIAVPLLLAMLTWLVFNVSGIKHHGFGHYMKNNLFPQGVPAPIYLLVTPIEFVSTFLLRPMTLTVRLLASMVAGHLLLVLFFSATSFLLFDSDAILKPFGLVAFAAGFGFTLFEVLVAFLQAYIFTLLTAVYIEGALAEAH